MQFQLSKALAKELFLHVQASVDLSPSALQWYGHCATVDGSKCVIMMEAQSRYAMVFCDMEKRDFEDFPGLFQQRLLREVSIIAQLEAPLAEPDLALLSDLVLDISAEEIFHPGSQRSVTSHLNQVRQHLEILVHDYDYSLPTTPDEAFRFGLKANDTPRMRQGSKEYFYPLRVFHDFWLGLLKCARKAGEERPKSTKAAPGNVIWGRFGNNKKVSL